LPEDRSLENKLSREGIVMEGAMGHLIESIEDKPNSSPEIVFGSQMPKRRWPFPEVTAHMQNDFYLGKESDGNQTSSASNARPFAGYWQIFKVRRKQARIYSQNFVNLVYFTLRHKLVFYATPSLPKSLSS
jgi:hypothetical protein